MARASERDPLRRERAAPFPLLLLFGKGEATLVLAAAVVGSRGPISWPWLLGAWLLAEGAWPALRWGCLEISWKKAHRSEGPPGLHLPYLQPHSPADRLLRAFFRFADALAEGARERPELPGALGTALVALGVGIPLAGGVGGWLTLGVVLALLLVRRWGHPGLTVGADGLLVGTFPWWLGLAGGTPSIPAGLVGVLIGLARMGEALPALRWIAWAGWVAWAVALGHGPGAYGLALIGLLGGEARLRSAPRARMILWALALACTAWILRTPPA